MLDDKALDRILRNARTHNGWLAKPVTDDQLRAIHDLAKWGPTSANSQPARFVFVRTKEGKEKLRPALSAGNTEKTMTAPVTAIVAYDTNSTSICPSTSRTTRRRSTGSRARARKRSRRRRRSATARCRAPI